MAKKGISEMSILWLGIAIVFFWLYFYSFGTETIFADFDNMTNQFFRIAMIIFFMFSIVMGLFSGEY